MDPRTFCVERLGIGDWPRGGAREASKEKPQKLTNAEARARLEAA